MFTIQRLISVLGSVPRKTPIAFVKAEVNEFGMLQVEIGLPGGGTETRNFGLSDSTARTPATARLHDLSEKQLDHLRDIANAITRTEGRG